MRKKILFLERRSKKAYGYLEGFLFEISKWIRAHSFNANGFRDRISRRRHSQQALFNTFSSRNAKSRAPDDILEALQVYRYGIRDFAAPRRHPRVNRTTFVPDLMKKCFQCLVTLLKMHIDYLPALTLNRKWVTVKHPSIPPQQK